MEAVFDLAAPRDHDGDYVGQIAWGDGSKTDVTVPAGMGMYTGSLRHAYESPSDAGGIFRYVA